MLSGILLGNILKLSITASLGLIANWSMKFVTTYFFISIYKSIDSYYIFSSSYFIATLFGYYLLVVTKAWEKNRSLAAEKAYNNGLLVY